MSERWEPAEQIIEQKDRMWRERGRLIRTKDRGRQGRYYWYRQAWTLMKQHAPVATAVKAVLTILGVVGIAVL